MYLKNYLLSLGAGGVICLFIHCMGRLTGGFQPVLKLLAGAFLLTVALALEPGFLPPALFGWEDSVTSARQEATAMGEALAGQAMQEGITERIRVYILEEAAKYHWEPEVEVTLSELTPVRVTLRGPVSPYTKAAMGKWIHTQLDIAPEDQLWVS